MADLLKHSRQPSCGTHWRFSTEQEHEEIRALKRIFISFVSSTPPSSFGGQKRNRTMREWDMRMPVSLYGLVVGRTTLLKALPAVAWLSPSAMTRICRTSAKSFPSETTTGVVPSRSDLQRLTWTCFPSVLSGWAKLCNATFCSRSTCT